MTNEYAPAAIRGVADQIIAAIPGAVFSGIVGDKAHVYGYHRARAVLPASDYSVTSTLDKQGDPWAASALDINFPPAQMKLVSARLMAAMRGKDPRVAPIREFFGAIDGTHVTGWDSQTNGFTTSDNSHLWHVHISVHRAYSNDAAALAGIASVYAGSGLSPSSGGAAVIPPASTTSGDFMANATDEQLAAIVAAATFILGDGGKALNAINGKTDLLPGINNQTVDARQAAIDARGGVIGLLDLAHQLVAQNTALAAQVTALGGTPAGTHVDLAAVLAGLTVTSTLSKGVTA